MGDSGHHITKLRGTANWEIWALRMEAVLTEKGYYDVMTGSLPPEEQAEDFRIHTAKSGKALASIRLACEDGPLLQIRNFDTPQGAWTELKRLYEATGFSAEFLICKRFFETTLTSCGGNVEEYLNLIRRLTDNLAAKKLPIPNKVIAAWTLNNLGVEYEHLVATITQSYRSIKGDIDIGELFSQLLDESIRLKGTRGGDEEMALTTNAKRNPKAKTKGEQPMCHHCGKTGHKSPDCWELHPEKKSKPKAGKRAAKSKQARDASVTIRSTNCVTSQPFLILANHGSTSHVMSSRPSQSNYSVSSSPVVEQNY